jgi:predicted DNA-binding transcriptional regulator AlpA
VAEPTPSQCKPRRNSRRRKLRPLAVPAKGVASLLSVGLRTVRTWDAAGKLPRPSRIGSKVLWNVSELREWLAAGCPPRDEWEIRKAAGK